MTDFDSRSLDDLFRAVAGAASSVELEGGTKVERLGKFGDLLVDGRPLNELAASEISSVIGRLKMEMARRFTDPDKNPMIRVY